MQAYNASMKQKNKILGGIARAKSLTKEERSMIAKNAANARWNSDLTVAGYEGEFFIGNVPISCAVLPNGKRIITQSTFLDVLGRSSRPAAGTGILTTYGDLPVFLSSDDLKPYISEEVNELIEPVFFKNKRDNRKKVGYDARLLPKTAEVYLRFRDEILKEKKEIPKRYQKMIIAADILMRGLADVGIIALIDEATGYQRDRARNALAKILEEFIAKELRPWIHTFPNEFYEQLFRLRGLSYPVMTIKKPQYFGHLTNDIIYARLAPSVLEELKKTIPRDEKGRHKYQFHRKLTEDMGHPKLRELLSSVITLMKISKNYQQFHKMLDDVNPRYNTTLPLPFFGQNEFD